ncbi:hypothetical protein EJ05DRAFT_213496 [Pseudovirgaria hyperparasitica]|uniref:Uncharacterized protein n=1 Tax=Pseudovirgaria hyperparasitica TaxID=470096 RepID=A0A6A6VTB8_9PEZI|nr:uncharacterized protein EJ05DRAFT_213496 [Pseudovirgaria hyperparasitica]KAF2753395.1 hypothetical protein EJ05DRAFT_213496 [Pseudovirgaria hyperparasitica]
MPPPAILERAASTEITSLSHDTMEGSNMLGTHASAFTSAPSSTSVPSNVPSSAPPQITIAIITPTQPPASEPTSKASYSGSSFRIAHVIIVAAVLGTLAVLSAMWIRRKRKRRANRAEAAAAERWPALTVEEDLPPYRRYAESIKSGTGSFLKNWVPGRKN